MPEIGGQNPDIGLRIANSETVSRVGGSQTTSSVDETIAYANSQAFPRTSSMGEAAPSNRSSAFDMGQVSTALPQTPSGNTEYARGPPLQHQQGPQSMLDQVPQMAPYGHPTMSSHYFSPGQHMPQYYSEGASHRPGASYYHQPQVPMAHSHAGYYFQQPPANYHVMANVVPQQRIQGVYGGTSQPGDSMYSSTPHDASRIGRSSQPMTNRPADTQSGAILGPPSKPKQSDHAIWIGNLPPQTDLMSLVQHVCKETTGLQSLFLISKSNCAFANYKESAESVAAQQKVHESRFQSVRLVSRLRNTASENPTVQAAVSEVLSGVSNTPPAPEVSSVEAGVPIVSEEATPKFSPAVQQRSESGPREDRFFILKSLTIKDLDKSVQSGVWATQSHNESLLNDAFEDASVENVFLIFSANKSGEYFGYARMLSRMDQDPAAAIEVAASVQSSSYADAPKIIWTEATETMPRGKIVDDSARGNIFWEIIIDDNLEAGAEASSEPSKSPSNAGQEPQKIWGKPFKLEWLSTNRLPFHRCRGLRNPLNSNREVKIARDGTQLEASVGRKLIGLFNSVHTPGPTAPGAMMRGPPPIGPMGGYPHNMHPYGQ